MYMKRFLTLLLALMLLCGLTCARAEQPRADQTIEYVGGVVFRVIPRDDPNAELINIAYIRCDAAYPVVGRDYEYRLVLSGGAAPYSCEVDVWAQSLSATTLSYSYYDTPEVEDDYSFTVNFGSEQRYFMSVTVTDANGQTLYFQGRPFETFSAQQETDASTIAGKVNQIISECITPEMSDYSRAKALHDWLIFNANYDYTYTNYDADGVLLLGTGVCDSYSKAYQLLLTAAGIESTIVTGFGNGEAHAWNLVKLGGSWYHVDCTWDDPGEGGSERWNYFCLTDEQMGQDHDWNRENTDPLIDEAGMVSPEATDDYFVQSGEVSVDHDFSFTTAADLTEGFNSIVLPARKGKMIARYLGTDGSGFYSAFGTWANEMSSTIYRQGKGSFARYGYFSRGGVYYYQAEIAWNDPLPYLRINETDFRCSVGETVNLVIAEQAADMTGVTWTSSNAQVASVSNGVIKCVGAGTAEIFAMHSGKVLDKVRVTVLAAYAPDFDLKLTKTGSGVTLTWNSIPGVTEYRIKKEIGGSISTITTVTGTSAALTDSQLSSKVEQRVYVQGVRRISGTDRLTYESDRLSYGHQPIVYVSVLPSDTAIIADRAFLNASLTTVDMPSGVTTIGSAAFMGCTQLTAVRIPASVTSIAANAFDGCTALKYAEVPSGSYAETWFAQHCPEVTIIH